MERLFSPCTRYRDMLEGQGRLDAIRRSHTEPLQELNLDVSTEELLCVERAFTYSDLYAVLLGNEHTVAWLTPHAAVAKGEIVERVVLSWMRLNQPYHFCFRADGKDIVALACSSEHLSEICDVVLRLLARSVVHSVYLQEWRSHGALINAPTLAYLMEHCPSLKLLSLKGVKMDENHCRVLGAYSRPDLEIILIRSKLTSAGVSALVELLERDQGPTELTFCDIDLFVLLDGLRGNSRLKSLTPRREDTHGAAYQERLVIASGNPDDVNRKALAIAGTLKENTGLAVCDLTSCLLTDETWNAICDSLKTHPTLKVLSLRWPMRSLGDAPLALAVLKSRKEALVDMLKVNMSIHTIRLSERYTGEHELFREAIIPYLESNRLRPRVGAIQKCCPTAYRAKVLGRALLAVRTDTNSVWMLLSGNPEVAFLSTTTAMIMLATNLPAPATAVATSNAAASASATAPAAVTATASWLASTTVVSAAASYNLATPTVCQKCKARP
jgi:hypothetical protein